MKIKDKIAKLIDVKSVISISMTATFCYLALKGVISENQFMLVFGMVIAFFFSKKSENKD